MELPFLLLQGFTLGLTKLNETNTKKYMNNNNIVRNASMIMNHSERHLRHTELLGTETQCTL